MTSCLEAAHEYLSLGLSPIPANGKRPLVPWKEYQECPPIAYELDEWWNTYPDANVGLVVGHKMLVVDLDGPGAEGLLHNNNIALPKQAPRVRTGNGQHVYLAVDDPVGDRIGLFQAPEGKPQVDIRGLGFVVAPPSLHPSGARYEWLVPFSLPLPRAPEILLRAIRTPRLTTSAEPTQRPDWVSESLRGVGQGLRDATCTKLAGYFIGKGLDRETTLAVLVHSFARNCTPPFPDEDVRKCVWSISARQAAAEAGEQAQRRPWEPPITVAELVATPPPEPVWLVKDLIRQKANGWLAAGAKVGKSFLALDLLLACALGRPWLDRFEIPRPLNVLLVEEEDDAWRIYQRVVKLARGRGMKYPATFHVSIRKGYRLDDPEGLKPLIDWLGTAKADLVVWDVFNRLHLKDERKPDQIMPVLWRLDRIRDELGVANLLAHHQRKQGVAGPDIAPGGQRLRGPSEFWGWAENSLYLSPLKAKGAVIVEPESKDAILEPFKVHLEDVDVDRRAWRYDGVVQAKAERGAETRDLIVSLLRGCPLSAEALLQKLGNKVKSLKTVKRHLDSLDNDGIVSWVNDPDERRRKLWMVAEQDKENADGPF